MIAKLSKLVFNNKKTYLSIYLYSLLVLKYLISFKEKLATLLFKLPINKAW